MIPKLIVLTAICVIAATATADARHRKWHHARHAPKAYVQPGPPLVYRQEPARMIEIKPGLYISSWGCVTDEGYGRYLPCGAGRDN